MTNPLPSKDRCMVRGVDALKMIGAKVRQIKPEGYAVNGTTIRTRASRCCQVAGCRGDHDGGRFPCPVIASNNARRCPVDI
jgi:hypothetical protein